MIRWIISLCLIKKSVWTCMWISFVFKSNPCITSIKYFLTGNTEPEPIVVISNEEQVVDESEQPGIITGN